MNTSEDNFLLSFKRLTFFKEMVDELISLSFFNEGEGTLEEQRRIRILGDIMDKEYIRHTGILTWYKTTFPYVWDAFESDASTECLMDLLDDKNKFIFNHINLAYYIMQWWVGDDDEPSDEFLNTYNSCWRKLEQEYGAYMVKHYKTS